MSMYPKGRPGTRKLPELPESRIASPNSREPRRDAARTKELTAAQLIETLLVIAVELRASQQINQQATGVTNTFAGALTVGEDLLAQDDLEVQVNFYHSNSVGQVGFYGTTPISQQTGVAVSSAGIHAALVNLGLITA